MTKLSMLTNFEEVFEDVTKSFIKIDTDKYLKKGTYPVIDQGEKPIAGFTDLDLSKCDIKPPFIVFGDHTRRFKYIDFDCCLGADGAKVLKPKIDADVKFLFYALKNIQLENNGYSRHYKFLKRKSIYLPPLAEQQRIAAILDKTELVKRKRELAIEKLDTLAQSIFEEMFGNIDTNVNSFPIINLNSICKRITDGTHQSPSWADSGIPFLFISNIIDGQIDYRTDKFISEATYKDLTRNCPIDINDILYTTVGSYGNVAIVESTRKFLFQRHIALIKPNLEVVNPSFLVAMLISISVRRQIDKVARGVAQKTVNLTQLKDIKIFCPPIKLQIEFENYLKKIKSQKDMLNMQFKAMEKINSSIQNSLFSGQL